MVEVEARIVGSSVDKGLGTVQLNMAHADATAADLVRWAVDEQIKELTAKRRLSAPEALQALRRQYQAAGAVPALPGDTHVDSARETQLALAAFSAGTCLLFVNGDQIHDLDQKLSVGIDTKVQFIRLVPLDGG